MKEMNNEPIRYTTYTKQNLTPQKNIRVKKLWGIKIRGEKIQNNNHAKKIKEHTWRISFGMARI